MRSWMMYAAGAGFLAGMMVTAAIVRRPADVAAPLGRPTRPTGPPRSRSPTMKKRPPPGGAATARERGRAAPVHLGRPFRTSRRQLTLPVHGIKRDDLRDTFNEMRGGTRRHEAIDVLAPAQHARARGRGRHGRQAVPERCRRHHDLPVRPDRDLRLLLRAPRALCGRA